MGKRPQFEVRMRIVCVGAGYFAQYHLEAWTRLPEAKVTAICEPDRVKAEQACRKFNIPKAYTRLDDALAKEKPDIVDIITPPETHYALCIQAMNQGAHVICQKPVSPDLKEAIEMVQWAERTKVRFLVHENFRFQPWYRKTRQLLDEGVLGKRVHTLEFRLRTGDGWAPDAYLSRQPYFRKMPRLLVYETGIHFIDTFRFLLGEVEEVYARLRKLNPAIAGEDCGIVTFQFGNGSQGVWDANRFNESNAANPRYTFGEMWLEGEKGRLRMDHDGQLWLKLLANPEIQIEYNPSKLHFSGDCVYATQQHLLDCLLNNQPSETEGKAYLRNLIIQEAIYLSAKENKPVSV
ncbi:MAG: Gfo/Idh/MocA family oxidoreductase [Haliscomenobacter sp.]|nr:Gfo/Idh/MocA family oxidoreductase [Haliscomenobacter sp.]